eukprot:13133509-Alexandrium_andersonii.AAC.1
MEVGEKPRWFRFSGSSLERFVSESDANSRAPRRAWSRLGWSVSCQGPVDGAHGRKASWSGTPRCRHYLGLS